MVIADRWRLTFLFFEMSSIKKKKTKPVFALVTVHIYSTWKFDYIERCKHHQQRLDAAVHNQLLSQHGQDFLDKYSCVEMANGPIVSIAQYMYDDD